MFLFILTCVDDKYVINSSPIDVDVQHSHATNAIGIDVRPEFATAEYEQSTGERSRTQQPVEFHERLQLADGGLQSRVPRQSPHDGYGRLYRTGVAQFVRQRLRVQFPRHTVNIYNDRLFPFLSLLFQTDYFSGKMARSSSGVGRSIAVLSETEKMSVR